MSRQNRGLTETLFAELQRSAEEYVGLRERAAATEREAVRADAEIARLLRTLTVETGISARRAERNDYLGRTPVSWAERTS